MIDHLFHPHHKADAVRVYNNFLTDSAREVEVSGANLHLKKGDDLVMSTGAARGGPPAQLNINGLNVAFREYGKQKVEIGPRAFQVPFPPASMIDLLLALGVSQQQIWDAACDRFEGDQAVCLGEGAVSPGGHLGVVRGRRNGAGRWVPLVLVDIHTRRWHQWKGHSDSSLKALGLPENFYLLNQEELVEFFS